MYPSIVYNYYKNIDNIRVRRTINYLRQNSPPLLDVGCGSKEISKAVNALSTDIDRRKRPDIVASICHLPIRDGCFETVCAFEVIEHVEEDELACQELRRVSRDKVVLSVPNAERYNIPLFPVKRRGFMSSDHKREYTIKEILQLASKVKLHGVRLKGIGYCIPLSFPSCRIGVKIFPLFFPRFATYIYIECTKTMS